MREDGWEKVKEILEERGIDVDENDCIVAWKFGDGYLAISVDG